MRDKLASGGRGEVASPSSVLITTSSFAATDRTPVARMEGAGLRVLPNPYGRRLTKVEIQAALTPDVVGLVAGLEPLDREVLSGSQLRAISRVGSGVANVDLEAAAELGIAVRTTPDGPTAAVAELTVGAMLSLLRAIPQMDRSLHERRWDKRIGGQLEGRTVAIIGFGRIGRRVADLLAPFRVRILAVDPHVDSAAGIELVSLEEALTRADVITLHNSGEDCLLDAVAFERMSQGVYILNAARGGLIDSAALLAALEEGRVAGAWLDTFPTEPYSGPLCDRPDVVLTPHVGSYTKECRLRMETEAVDNLLEALGHEAER